MARAEQQAFALAAAAAFVAGCVESGSFLPAAPTVPAPRLPMNDAYVGSVHSGRAGALSPRFVWEGSTASAKGEVRYELQYSRDVGFAAGETTTVETAETWHQVAGELPVSREAPVGARYYWRVRACLRESCSEYTRTWWVNLGRVIKDYNGDGYSDVAVGAPGNDGVLTNAGRVLVYYGGPGRVLETQPDRLLGGNDVASTDAPIGRVVSHAGDVNGDGFADLLLGNPGAPPTQPRGGAFLYLGGADGAFDAIVDLGVRSEVAGDEFGYRVAAAGDLNADGHGDFVVGAYAQGSSKAYVYFGNADGRPTQQLAATIDPPALARIDDVRGAGDLDGDGFAELVIGGTYDARHGTNRGVVEVYRGGPGETLDADADVTLQGADSDDRFGAMVASSDFTCDGFSDLAVAAERGEDSSLTQPGRVDVFLGSATLTTRAAVSLSGQVSRDAFGLSMEGAGDVNGDGCEDLVIGARSTRVEEVSRGRGYVFFGASALVAAPAGVLLAPSNSSYAFYSVVGAGDLNGDGYSDVAAGAPSLGPAGSVEVYLGAAGVSFDATADSRLVGQAADDAFGTSLARRGEARAVRSRLRHRRR